MKHYTILFSILCLLLYIAHIQPEGFFAGTLVKTPSQYCFIEILKPQDKVISFIAPISLICRLGNPYLEGFTCCFSSYYSDSCYNYSNNSHSDISIITKTIQYQSDSYVKITIGDSIICCAPDQKLYSYNRQKWIRADTLTCTDQLINDIHERITIDSIAIIQQPCIFHALSLTPHHTYCVSLDNIVVHNTGPVIVVYLPAIVSTITPIVETCLATAATFFGIQFFAKKFKHKQHASSMNSSSSNNCGSYYPDPNDPHDDKNKRNDKEHPHGIYKDAPYHHKNSSGSKSQSPKNGQRCLDYSLPTETNQRVAIEGENFILLKYTSPGNYHGHVVTWKQLDQNIRSILIKNCFAKNSGKIIRQITEKYQL